MSTTQRKMTSASVKAIMSKRTIVTNEHVGHKVKITVQGDGNVIDVKDKAGELVMSAVEEGTVLQKKIFNCRAASALAMRNPRNIEFLKAGLAAEKAGDAEGAHENFNKYLNATQISFGVLLPSNTAEKIGNGQEIAAVVERVDTENGSLLTLDSSTISMVAPTTLSAAAFDLSDFIEEEEETPAPVVKAPKAKASKA
jgi:hypothetical protein